ncbi:MAG: DUF4395 family protein [bacterium]
MQQCLIYDSSLKASRATYGLLILLAILIHNQWLVLAVVILMVLGLFSLKLNFPYQIHALVSKKVFKRKHNPMPRELSEVNFVAGMTSVLLFVGFLLIYLDKYVTFAWIYLLVVDLMIFLACLVGFCVATLMYVSLKKVFKYK